MASKGQLRDAVTYSVVHSHVPIWQRQCSVAKERLTKSHHVAMLPLSSSYCGRLGSASFLRVRM